MVLGTADAAKWVSRQKNRLPQPRATISTSMAAGRCGRPTAEAAERRLEAGVFAAFQTSDGGSVDFAELLHPGVVLVFDLKTESEWGEPGPPTADPDHPGQLGPCMCTPRRYC